MTTRDPKGQWPKEQWLEEQEEFREFVSLGAAGIRPEPSVLPALKARLFPNPWLVFAKIAGLHAITGGLSLGLCHQFGLNPFRTPYSLADLFMATGSHHFCMVACGLTFIAGTYLLAGMFLTLEELEAVRRQHWLQTACLSAGSLAVFHMFGADLVAIFAGLWLIGALAGGLASFEGVYLLRRRMV